MLPLEARSVLEVQIDDALLRYARTCLANEFGAELPHQKAYQIRRPSLYRHMAGLFEWFTPVSFNDTLARLYHAKTILVVQDEVILFSKSVLAAA